ncbi:HNH endonuclease [Rhizobium leguminosarum]|uniref:HNH endonuclease family protein n=1 Tax=Rhizobium leguminosarum TaxID=384 RepID=UPI001C94CC3A|nr:HNH endonuclease [Rhizobium leguminosarum]MBY5669188.1 HNH endonuclease [Rhizobium leguminosarum]MBY5685979.1 HNH endonuclease [Rhizobium leguminosarum]
MAGSVVNLDAMIPREDMLTPASDYAGVNIERISISNLDNDFFVHALRKPDFQRETAHWSPEKIVDLVKAFASGDLIPAVILWRRGTNIFVIDGAHRLSALIAWVYDDYGQGARSLTHFGGRLSDEQVRIADKTRKLVGNAVGPYAQFVGAMKSPHNAPDSVKSVLGNLAANAVVAQWVPKVGEKAAEDSFFKINQAATPIDPTERLILRSRQAANAIASRAIVRGGTGHKYWAGFPLDIQAEIESEAGELHSALYEPPLKDLPIKTLDLPVAGRGYSALPFVYELVNWANDVPDYTKSKEPPPADIDGKQTLAHLRTVRDAVDLITGIKMKSLGLHPVVYFYTRGGDFQPVAFIAACAFVRELAKAGRLPKFTKVRGQFEEFLLRHKEFITLIIKRTGAGRRSLGRIIRYFETLLREFTEGNSEEQVLDVLRNDPEFVFLVASMGIPSVRHEGDNPTRRFSRSTKSASFFQAATQGGVRCGVCHALVHVNSMQFDHIDDKAVGGSTGMQNSQATHPYCNSAKAILIPT